MAEIKDVHQREAKGIEPALSKFVQGRAGGPGSDIYCNGSCKGHAVLPGMAQGLLSCWLIGFWVRPRAALLELKSEVVSDRSVQRSRN
jgi:hypothetical protein